MAEHLRTVQWAVRPDTKISSRPVLFDTLPVKENLITSDEVITVLKALKKGKAPGHDGLNPEFWKACASSEIMIEWILNRSNQIMKYKTLPDQWKIAKVACLYKKGDPAMPDNYRPVSLLAVGYKIFSSVLLNRLKSAGAEARISETQYGFKSGAGTRDAVFIVRRLLVHSWSNAY